jgi:hypothetical protein
LRKPVSPTALAEYLLQLAELNSSTEYGNLALADALRALAKDVRRRSLQHKTGQEAPPRSGRSKQPPLLNSDLLELDHAAIEKFLADEQKSKEELLDLAAARFSMPRSQLKRMKILDIRQAISSALLHETSIEIISRESRREGSERTS